MTIPIAQPEYLTSLDKLQQHFRAEFEGLSTVEKGDKFAHFVQRLIPQTDIGSNFDEPVLSEKRSNDGGVDLRSNSRFDQSVLYIQSKLYVDRSESVDSVISKFEAYSSTTFEGNETTEIQQELLFSAAEQAPHFLLITLSQLTGIIEKYEKTPFSSKDFYNKLISEGRIHFIDGLQILETLRTAYKKISYLPTQIVLNLETQPINIDGVYIGIISSEELKSLHSKFGDALFFENVRDFLGNPRSQEKSGRTTPNSEIIKTLTLNPDKMLSRNNGIVFGAQEVNLGESQSQLVLTNGSLVNGCQTTMCIVEFAQQRCSVLVKVVQTVDAWDITKSANYQTSVPDIDLELARYLRPQLVKRAALNLSTQLDNVRRSAFQIIDEIYERKVTYDETRLLYIGLFSRNPNNVFGANYTELIQNLIANLYKDPGHEEDIFDTLFMLQAESRKALDNANKVFSDPSYSSMFGRLYKEESLVYRCFLAIVALCGVVNVNIADHNSDITLETSRVRSFLEKSREVLKSKAEIYARFYLLAVKLWMQGVMNDDDDAEVRQNMFLRSKGLNFTSLFKKIRMEADLDSFNKDNPL